MTGKNGSNQQTIEAPVTVMEKVPAISDDERKELLASLEQAQEDIANGKGVQCDPDELVAQIKAAYYNNKTA